MFNSETIKSILNLSHTEAAFKAVEDSSNKRIAEAIIAEEARLKRLRLDEIAIGKVLTAKFGKDWKSKSKPTDNTTGDDVKTEVATMKEPTDKELEISQPEHAAIEPAKEEEPKATLDDIAAQRPRDLPSDHVKDKVKESTTENCSAVERLLLCTECYQVFRSNKNTCIKCNSSKIDEVVANQDATETVFGIIEDEIYSLMIKHSPLVRDIEDVDQTIQDIYYHLKDAHPELIDSPKELRANRKAIDAALQQLSGQEKTEIEVESVKKVSSSGKVNEADDKGNGRIFTSENVKDVIEKIKTGLKFPFVNAYPSNLGGNENIAIMLGVSLDPKDKWTNGIYQNSRFANIIIDNNGDMEMFTKQYTLKEYKFRKTKVKSIDDAIAKLNAWGEQAKNAKGTSESVFEADEEYKAKVVAKGIEKKEDADKLAAEKKGQVIADEADNTKFAVVVKESDENVQEILSKEAEDDERPDENYDISQLKMGTEVEMEHTDNVEVAKKIAKDHLDEMPDYYTKLKRMEAGELDNPKTNEAKEHECDPDKPCKPYSKKDTVRLVRKADTNEWLVRYYEDGKYSEEKTSYHSDKADAEATMKDQQKKIDAASESIKKK